MTNVIIPEGVTTIGWQAFYSCFNLNNIVIPSTVTTIYGGTFYQNPSISSYRLNNITFKNPYNWNKRHQGNTIALNLTNPYNNANILNSLAYEFIYRN